MKTLSNKLISIFIFSVIFLSISCKNQLNNFIQTEKATVTFSISKPQERIIYPDLISDITEFENFTLSYGLIGNDHEIIKEYDSIEKKTYEDFINTKIELEPGLYSFNLQTQKEASYFAATAETTIKSNEENFVSFILKNEETDPEIKGHIKAKFFFDLPEDDDSDNLFTINITNMFDKDGEKILIPTEPTENEDGKKYIDVEAELNSGYYLVTVNFEINDYSDLEAAYPGISLRDTMSEAFYVCSGHDTNYESEIRSLNRINKIVYMNTEGYSTLINTYNAYNAKQVFTALSKNPPAKEDFILARWYVDEELKTPFENFLNSEGDVTLYASWKKKEAVTPSFKYQFQDSEGYTFSLEDKVIDGFRTEKIIAFPSAFFDLDYLVQFIDPIDGEIAGKFPLNESISEGTYNLKVTAVYEDLTLSKEINDFIVSKDFTEPYIITFLPDSSSPEGHISLQFKDSLNIFGSYSADPSGLYKTEHSNTENWIADNVTPGSYKTQFEFFDKDNKSINTINDVSVLVWPGFTTDCFFGPENLVTENHELIIEAGREFLLENEPSSVKSAYKIEGEEFGIYFNSLKFDFEHVFNVQCDLDSTTTDAFLIYEVLGAPYINGEQIAPEVWTSESEVTFDSTTLENDTQAYTLKIATESKSYFERDNTPGLITCMGKWGLIYQNSYNNTIAFTDYGKQLYNSGIREFKNEIWNSNGDCLSINQINGYLQEKPGFLGDLIPKELYYSDLSEEELENLSPATDYILKFTNYSTLENFEFPKKIKDDDNYYICFDFSDDSNTFTEIPSYMDAANNEKGTFDGYWCMSELKMNDNVTKIGNFAFMNAYIKQIEMSENITEIGKSAFYTSKLTNINLPNGLKVIGENAFGETRTKDIIIPDTVEEIGSKAFYYNTGITSITIPSSVKTIGDEAFNSCSNLKEITIQGTVTTFGNKVFTFIHNIESFIITSENAFSLGEEPFQYCSNPPTISVPEALLDEFKNLNPGLNFEGYTFI
ncbi:MAG: leucine-rich repeat domain-containing protein [Treponema sp.]|nr:leucine-rich repeat domain-containing protein [Treponema sp.]